jgi:hypothetical protein
VKSENRKSRKKKEEQVLERDRDPKKAACSNMYKTEEGKGKRKNIIKRSVSFFMNNTKKEIWGIGYGR